MDNYKEIGRGIAEGALGYIGGVFVIGFLIVFLGGVIADIFSLGTDDSDKDGRNRSGLKVHTDHKTGIQYLSDGKGGLVRRETK